MARRCTGVFGPAQLTAVAAGLLSMAGVGFTWTQAGPWSTASASDTAIIQPAPTPPQLTLPQPTLPQPTPAQPTADAPRVGRGAGVAAAPAGGRAGVDPTAGNGRRDQARPGARAGAVGTAAGGSTRSMGRMCLFAAPEGALGAGHAGWAFRLADGRWVEGATENNSPEEGLVALDGVAAFQEITGLEGDATRGSLLLEPGADTGSWIREVGTFDEVRADFRGALSEQGRSMHDAGYYTAMRCADQPAPNPAAALAKARELATSGYRIGDDNCLTKAVEVLHAYGARLPDAAYELPNDYLEWELAPFGPTTPI